jgi:hypothetical protein
MFLLQLMSRFLSILMELLGSLFKRTIMSFAKAPQNVTYAELAVAKNNSRLKIGQQYRMTDFRLRYRIKGESIYNDDATVAVGLRPATEPLILTAIAANKFAREVTSENFPQDIIHYEFDDSSDATHPCAWLADRGVIKYREDTIRNVKVSYDFRNFIFYVSEEVSGSGIFNISDNSNPGFNKKLVRTFDMTNFYGVTPSGENLEWIRDIEILPCVHGGQQPIWFSCGAWKVSMGFGAENYVLDGYFQDCDFGSCNRININVPPSFVDWQYNINTGSGCRVIMNLVAAGDPQIQNLDILSGAYFYSSEGAWSLIVNPSNGGIGTRDNASSTYFRYTTIGFCDLPQNVTYSELSTLQSGSSLIEGQKYCITDYSTRHRMRGTCSSAYWAYSAGYNDLTYNYDSVIPVGLRPATEPLIVMATSTNTLSPEAHSALFPQDIIHYSLTDPTAGGDEGFLIGCDRGWITYREDTALNVKTPYDFRNVLTYFGSTVSGGPTNIALFIANNDSTTIYDRVAYKTFDMSLYGTVNGQGYPLVTNVEIMPNSNGGIAGNWFKAEVNKVWLGVASEGHTYNVDSVDHITAGTCCNVNVNAAVMGRCHIENGADLYITEDGAPGTRATYDEVKYLHLLCGSRLTIHPTDYAQTVNKAVVFPGNIDTVDTGPISNKIYDTLTTGQIDFDTTGSIVFATFELPRVQTCIRVQNVSAAYTLNVDCTNFKTGVPIIFYNESDTYNVTIQDYADTVNNRMNGAASYVLLPQAFVCLLQTFDVSGVDMRILWTSKDRFTQAAGDNSIKMATTAYVRQAAGLSKYQTLLQANSYLVAAAAAGTYIVNNNVAIASGTGTLIAPPLVYLDSADYPTIDGLAPKLRLRVTTSVNNVAASGTFKFALYPVTSGAGAANLKIWSVGTSATGSVVGTVSAPAASSTTTLTGSDFSFPSNGMYCIGLVTTGVIPTSSEVQFHANLQLHNA